KPGPIFVNRKGEGGFAGIQTFAKLPVCLTPEDLVAGEMDVAICGVPWDATAGGRSGTNHGPLAIRACDYKGGYGRSHYSLDVRVDAFAELKVCDYGDSPIRTGNTVTTFEEIRKFIGTIVDSGVIPIILGGDHDHLAVGHGGGRPPRLRQGRDRPLRRARRHRPGSAGDAREPRHPDAQADRERRRAGPQLRAGRAARLLAGRGDPRLDGRAGHAHPLHGRDQPGRLRHRARTGRGRGPRPGRPPLHLPRHRRGGPGVRAGHRHPGTARPHEHRRAHRRPQAVRRGRDRRDGRGRGQPALRRPRGDHRAAGQPRGAGGPHRHRHASQGADRARLPAPGIARPRAPAGPARAGGDRMSVVSPTRRPRAALAGAIAAVLLLSGCGGAAAGPATASPAPTDGVLRLGLLGDIGQPPDPDVYYSGNGLALTTNMYEGLVRYQPGVETPTIVESLATSWEVSPDNTVFTFHLREGVLFHDGTPFTSEAVAASFERRLAVGAGPAYMVEDVAAVETPDE